MSDRQALKFFEQTFQNACRADTAFMPETWAKDNPAEGHCGIAAVMIAEIFGGNIVILKFDGPTRIKGRHFFNLLPDGKRADATFTQFIPRDHWNDIERYWDDIGHHLKDLNCEVEFTPPLTTGNEVFLERTQTFLKNENFDGTMLEYMMNKPQFTHRYETMRSRMKEYFPVKRNAIKRTKDFVGARTRKTGLMPSQG